jgi:hypothetical protein
MLPRLSSNVRSPSIQAVTAPALPAGPLDFGRFQIDELYFTNTGFDYPPLAVGTIDGQPVSVVYTSSRQPHDRVRAQLATPVQRDLTEGELEALLPQLQALRARGDALGFPSFDLGAIDRMIRGIEGQLGAA